MKRLHLIFAILSAVVFVPSAAAANLNTLQDWCVNVSGDLSSCNGSMTSNAAVNLSAFDTAISLNNLGTASITLSEGSGQYVGFYADYDLDYADYLSYNDSAFTAAALVADQTDSIGDPNVFVDVAAPSHYALFNLFANNTLDNGNTAGTPGSDPQCCDIAFAMAFSNINVDSGGHAVVTFTVSSTAPQSGFYITQASNDGSVAPLYLSGDVSITSGSPEPSTFLLGAGSLVLGGFFVRRRRIAAIQS
jgi:MYXO-CTERM domain-containing protein